MSIETIAVVAAVVISGLIAGFFWGWQHSSVPGLRKVADPTYVEAMQNINAAILNPVFLMAFTGSLLVLAGASVLSWQAGDTRRAWWLGAAAATYAVGVFGVTAAGNVPLNDRLRDFDAASATPEQIAEARHAYEGPWNRLHAVRSLLGVLVLTLAAAAAATPPQD